MNPQLKKHPLARSSDAFVSYSHADAELLAPLIQLLRLYRRQVFTDREIEPGERWRSVLDEAIESAKSVAVFWCCHSAASKEVAWEIECALNRSKPIVPFLLCHQSVISPLSDFQWIDLSETVTHTCGVHGSAVLDLVPAKRLDPERAPSAAPGTKFGTGFGGHDWARYRPWVVQMFDLAEDGKLASTLHTIREQGDARESLE